MARAKTRMMRSDKSAVRKGVIDPPASGCASQETASVTTASTLGRASLHMSIRLSPQCGV